MVVEYVNKKRSADHNVLDEASLSKPVEVGAVWSTPAPPGRKRSRRPRAGFSSPRGHFIVDPRPMPGQPTLWPALNIPAGLAARLYRCASRKELP
jgi:lipoprotein-anchoring transpeptidase ErfK/SrfK